MLLLLLLLLLFLSLSLLPLVLVLLVLLVVVVVVPCGSLQLLRLPLLLCFLLWFRYEWFLFFLLRSWALHATAQQFCCFCAQGRHFQVELIVGDAGAEPRGRVDQLGQGGPKQH